jgi:hypothetical protein
MSRGQPYIVPPKLSDRLSIASYIALASALLLAVVALSTIEYINLRRTLLQDTQVEAKILADNVAAALLFNDTRAAHESVATMRASPTIERISILRNDGSVFVPVAAVDPAIAALAQPRVQHRYAFDHLDLIHPIEHEKNLIGYVHLRKTLTRMYQQIALYSASALGVAGVALLLAWLVVARVQRTVTIAEKTLHSLAHIDATTALWNRNTFNLHLQGAISAAQKPSRRLRCYCSTSITSRRLTMPSGIRAATPCSRRWPNGSITFSVTTILHAGLAAMNLPSCCNAPMYMLTPRAPPITSRIYSARRSFSKGRNYSQRAVWVSAFIRRTRPITKR